MKNKLAVTSVLFFTYFSTLAQCTYCTDWQEALKQPSKVETLDLRAKGLREIPAEMNQFSNLRELNLSDNFIFEIDYSKIQLPTVERLIIKNNPGFYTLEMEGFSSAFPNLEQLTLEGNSIKFLSPEIANLKKLERLNLANNSISILPEEIENMGNLKSLNLSSNNLLEQNNLFSGLWHLKELNIANNDSLRTASLFKALLFKDELKSLTMSINGRTVFTKEFNDLHIQTLELVNSSNIQLPSQLRSNKSIQTVVFDNCSFENPVNVFEVLNEIDSIQMVVFRNMDIPPGLSSLKTLKELHLNSARIIDAKDLSKLSSKTTLLQNNVSFADTTKNLTSGANPYFSLSKEMLENDSPCIKDVSAKMVGISSKEESVIKLENSSYVIPTDAFLNQDGTLYEGEVTVSIKEYMDPIINALAGMPMVMNEDGQANLFSSNGMIEFNAEDDKGNALLPNPEQIIQVELVDLQPSEQSDLFVYDSIQKNWERIGQPVSNNRDSILQARINAINRMTPNELVSTRRIYPLVTMKYKRKSHDPTQLFVRVDQCDRYEKAIASKGYFFLDGKAMQEVGDMKWEVDTVITDELSQLFFSINKAQKRSFKYMKRDKIRTTMGVPRLITDLKITPDLERDNYRMTFNFKGEKINIPVYQTIEKNASGIQKIEAKSYQSYNNAISDDEKDEAVVAKHKERFIKNEAPKLRQQLIEAAKINNTIVIRNESPDMLRFGLTKFGIINCDYFSRNKPDEYLALAEFSKDQDGKLVKIPAIVQNILSYQNVFLSTYSNSVPYYNNQNNIILFSIDEYEIAVIKSNKKLKNSSSSDNNQIPIESECIRINITNLLPSEVRKLIMDV